jgi:hypothetical protein
VRSCQSGQAVVAGSDRPRGPWGPASGHRGADDQEGQGPGDAGRRCQAPPGHPAAPDYPGTSQPTEIAGGASTSGARAANRYPEGPSAGVAGEC